MKMMSASQTRVVKAAIQIIDCLCSLRSTCIAVIDNGGLRELIPLINSRDGTVRIRVARVLDSISQHDLPSKYLYDEVAMKIINESLREDFVESDEPISFALMRYCLKATQYPDHLYLLVTGGLSEVMLHKLDNQFLNLQHILYVIQILTNVCKEPRVHRQLLEDERILQILVHVIFHDIPLRRADASFLRGSNSTVGSKTVAAGPLKIKIGGMEEISSMDGSMAQTASPKNLPGSPSRPRTPGQPVVTVEVEIVRKLIQIMLCFVDVDANAEAIINTEVFAQMGVGLLTDGPCAGDKKIRASVATVLQRLSHQSVNSPTQCHKLSAQGALDLACHFLLQHDQTRRAQAVHSLSIFAKHTNLQSLLCSDGVLEEILALGYVPTEVAPVIELIDRISEIPAFVSRLLDAGALEVMLHTLKDRDVAHSKSSTNYVEETMLSLMKSFDRMIGFEGVRIERIRQPKLPIDFISLCRWTNRSFMPRVLVACLGSVGERHQWRPLCKSKVNITALYSPILILNLPYIPRARDLLKKMREETSAMQIQLVVSGFVARVKARRQTAVLVQEHMKAMADKKEMEAKLKKLEEEREAEINQAADEESVTGSIEEGEEEEED